MGPTEEEGQMEEEEGGSYDSGLPPLHFDPAQWKVWAEDAQKAEEVRMSDPQYRDLKNGLWDYGKDPRGSCIAMFLTLRGGVLLMDWTGETGEEKGTFLAFFSGSIPKAERIEKTEVSLTQSGETQSVQAFHAPLAWAKDVSVSMFAVPSTEALLSSIEDVQDFDVRMVGQSVVWGSWHSGLEARNWLRECVSSRSKT